MKVGFVGQVDEGDGVTEIKDFFLRKAKLFTNAKVFDLNYQPNRIITDGRIREFEEVTQEIATFVKYRTPTNILIVGDAGSGKTVTINYVIDEIRKLIAQKVIADGLGTFYVNCKNRDYRDVLTGLQIQEWSQETEHNSIVDILNRINYDFILILDEIDKGKELDSFLYKLSRPQSVLPNYPHNICLVLISNDLNFEQKLNLETRSSLNLKIVKFPNYARHSLYKILLSRAETGIRKDDKIVTQKILDFLAGKVAEKYGGDARYAIVTLKRALQIAETKGKTEITENDIVSLLPKVVEQIAQERVSELPNKQFFVLYTCLKSQSKSLQGIFEFYKNQPANIFPQFARTTFYNQIDYLETHGFVEKETTIIQGTIGGREHVVRIKIEAKLIIDEYKKRTYTASETNGHSPVLPLSGQ